MESCSILWYGVGCVCKETFAVVALWEGFSKGFVLSRVFFHAYCDSSREVEA